MHKMMKICKMRPSPRNFINFASETIKPMYLIP